MAVLPGACQLSVRAFLSVERGVAVCFTWPSSATAAFLAVLHTSVPRPAPL
jgi:hypothetical protein